MDLEKVILEIVPEFFVPPVFDYVAVFLWAVSGAIVGMHKRYDFAGVFMIALLASTGGGVLRDGIFLNQTPPVLVDIWYLPLILAATVVVALFRRRIARMVFVDRLISIIDALGVPAFAVLGMELALAAGVYSPGVVLVGVLNGFGGGLLRDVVVGDTPAIFKPGQFAISPLIFLCVFFVALVQGLEVNMSLTAWGVIALYFTIRMLAIRYNWQTSPVLRDLPYQ